MYLRCRVTTYTAVRIEHLKNVLLELTRPDVKGDFNFSDKTTWRDMPAWRKRYHVSGVLEGWQVRCDRLSNARDSIQRHSTVYAC
jgi:hypothetical protein